MESGSNDPRALRIFVVENDSDTLKYLTIYLQSLGHAVFSAKGMAEALKAIPQANCDVLISDIGLHDGSGCELMQKLREQELAHPQHAIAMSGFGARSDLAMSERAGFQHHLLKPFDPQELDQLLLKVQRAVAAHAVAHD